MQSPLYSTPAPSRLSVPILTRARDTNFDKFPQCAIRWRVEVGVTQQKPNVARMFRILQQPSLSRISRALCHPTRAACRPILLLFPPTMAASRGQVYGSLYRSQRQPDCDTTAPGEASAKAPRTNAFPLEYTRAQARLHEIQRGLDQRGSRAHAQGLEAGGRSAQKGG